MSRETMLLTEDDLYLFNEGAHFRLYEKLGVHPLNVNRQEDTYFALWAPDAEQVSVIAYFNGWNRASHPLQLGGQADRVMQKGRKHRESYGMDALTLWR